MSHSYRRPYLVEAVSYFPVVSDPEQQTFSVLSEALDWAQEQSEEYSRFVMVYERGNDGEWIELPKT